MGSVVLSLDAELAWGFHDLDRVPEDRIDSARRSWRWLLKRFDRYEFPVTWAIVGHLVLSSCDGAHLDHPAPAEWFARDPGGVATETSAWMAPDLIEAIQQSAVDHEIGCHTYSHVEFDTQTTPRALAAAELELSLAIADQAGIDMESFVFPRNRVGYRELLADAGFSCYRGSDPHRWYDWLPYPTVGKTLEWAADSSSTATVRPRLDSYGLLDIPASLYIFTIDGISARLINQFGVDPVVQRAKAGIDAAVDSDEVFHMWLHPNNIVRPFHEQRVECILEYLYEQRQGTDLAVRTMGEVAAKCQ